MQKILKTLRNKEHITATVVFVIWFSIITIISSKLI